MSFVVRPFGTEFQKEPYTISPLTPVKNILFIGF